jgi:hypothetical protein
VGKWKTWVWFSTFPDHFAELWKSFPQLPLLTAQAPITQFSRRFAHRFCYRAVFGKVPVQDLAQLNAHWYESLFIAFAVNQKDEVVEVHILAREAEQLAYPQPGVKRDQGDSMGTGFVTADGLPVYKPGNVLWAKRG